MSADRGLWHLQRPQLRRHVLHARQARAGRLLRRRPLRVDHRPKHARGLHWEQAGEVLAAVLEAVSSTTHASEHAQPVTTTHVGNAMETKQVYPPHHQLLRSLHRRRRTLSVHAANVPYFHSLVVRRRHDARPVLHHNSAAARVSLAASKQRQRATATATATARDGDAPA